MPVPPAPISVAEHRERLARLCDLTRRSGIGATLLGSTSNLRYFTGVKWSPSERFLGAIVHGDGALSYIAPRFELDKVRSLVGVEGEILTWEEEASPYALIAHAVGPGELLAVDDRIQLFMFTALRSVIGDSRLVDGGAMMNALRCRKSAQEIALMAHAKAITLEVQRRAHAYLRTGMYASQVARFIDDQHRALGAAGSTFCLVSFGEDSCLPHGGETDRALKRGDVVLIDTGTEIEGYNSDITRTYVFGRSRKDFRAMWDLEKEAQAAAFAAATLGKPCHSPDDAARRVIEAAGLGPDYRLPGLPHRTGHGIGLDIHESPNLVRGDFTPLDVGMCFSCEPMIVLPGRFGIRLEDHFHMTPDGPAWFTEPAAAPDDPFANAPVFAPA